jgi:hypothetical protein
MTEKERLAQDIESLCRSRGFVIAGGGDGVWGEIVILPTTHPGFNNYPVPAFNFDLDSKASDYD